MYKALSILSLVLLLPACEMTQPEPYQKDRKPEHRTEYNGAEGLAQAQKDKVYLMNKELADKCEQARTALIVAQENNDTADIKRQNSIIKDTCVN
ncbi:hypothetical protein MHM98_11165 [Psychrobium sp. MM17-31]|uniref:hypothetical protein n=1 Tax=Psychrobium sp. MM17-31 TaxID=2917758 RepID=UPI001EF72FE3|nr:hypothetical protein [Psychrobium sp. MM17-31]MCG7531896.1 hypothetical protein [Psychrobium sp. MM17-31]